MRTLGVPSLVAVALALAACGGGETKVETPPQPEPEGADGPAAVPVPVTPEKPAPPALTEADEKDLASLCAAIEPEMYDASKQAEAVLVNELAGGTADEAAEAKALEAGMTMLKEKATASGDAKRCMELFEKRTRFELFSYEPAEEAARDTIDTCVKRVVATFGKANMSFDMGGSGQRLASQGPFCPDDFPVPTTLDQLPYKSSASDWDTAAWKCLSFGLRIEQPFQIEYAAPVGEGEFYCIARLLPRQGGAPIELIRGGRVNAEGALEVGEKIQKRRMQP